MIEPRSLPVIEAEWQVPTAFKAFTTTREGGSSEAPFATLNLGDHVGDAPARVAHNRDVLSRLNALPSTPIWLNQVHGARVAEVGVSTAGTPLTADASVTREHDCVLAILTADCLPIVLASPEHQVVAAIHGGWRSLADGIIENTIMAMDCPPSTVHAWLGPAIGPTCFEVGDDVWDRFVANDWQMGRCFKANKNQKYLADLFAIARRLLDVQGVRQVSGGQHCTLSDGERFFSHRRRQPTGRMATLVWMAA
ncbi:MAG: peptidoglycan editing factor PgeF [Pseudomonadota bacterium]